MYRPKCYRYHYSYHNFIITILCYALSVNACTVGDAIQMTVYNITIIITITISTLGQGGK